MKAQWYLELVDAQYVVTMKSVPDTMPACRSSAVDKTGRFLSFVSCSSGRGKAEGISSRGTSLSRGQFGTMKVSYLANC